MIRPIPHQFKIPPDKLDEEVLGALLEKSTEAADVLVAYKDFGIVVGYRQALTFLVDQTYDVVKHLGYQLSDRDEETVKKVASVALDRLHRYLDEIETKAQERLTCLENLLIRD